MFLSINKFNLADEHLKFAHKLELDQKFCFLDVKVERKNNKQIWT